MYRFSAPRQILTNILYELIPSKSIMGQELEPLNSLFKFWLSILCYQYVSTREMGIEAFNSYYSRYVISWELNDSLHIGFVLESSKKRL